MKYFEVIFDNGTNEVETMGSICIVGSETPTKEELEGDIIFRQDMKLFNSDHIYAIDELSKEEAFAFFDMDNVYFIFKDGKMRRVEV